MLSADVDSSHRTDDDTRVRIDLLAAQSGIVSPRADSLTGPRAVARSSRRPAGVSEFALVIVAALVSAYPAMSASLIVLAVVLATSRALVVGRRTILTAPLLSLLLVRILLGWGVGSVPQPWTTQFIDFVLHEGRELLTLGLALALSIAGVGRGAWERTYPICVRTGHVLLVASVVWFVARPTVFGQGNFHFLAGSHHVTGLVGSALLLRLVYGTGEAAYYRSHHLAAIAGCGLTILLSGSRTSLVGLAAVAVVYLVKTNSLHNRLRLLLALVACSILAFSISPRVRSTIQAATSGILLSPEDVGTVVSDGSIQRISLEGSQYDTATANVLKRYGAWGYAFEQASLSPILGVGPWRLNDVDVELRGSSVFSYYTGPASPRGASAHNLFLEFGAESGLVGIALFVWLLARIAAHDRARCGSLPGFGPSVVALFVGASLSSNAMLSPAFGLPVLILIIMRAEAVSATNESLTTHEWPLRA